MEDKNVSMECDSSSLPHLWVHPLALVSIGDHGARLLHGGVVSSNAATAAMGLLWGSVDATTDTIELWDAEDAHEPLERVIDPRQVIVGWYRVSHEEAEEPTRDDLRRSQEWKQKYAPHSTAPFLLALLSSSSSSSSNHPVSFYLLPPDASTLRVLEYPADWSLRTAPAERLAVERLFHVTPPAWTELDARLERLQAAVPQAPELVQGLLDHLALGPSLGPPPSASSNATSALLPTLVALAQCVAATQPYLEKHRVLLQRTDGIEERAAGGVGGPWKTSRRHAAASGSSLL